MTDTEFIASGILEEYALGMAGAAECDEVLARAAINPSIRLELEAIEKSLEKNATANAIEPDPMVRPFLMATINYSERLKNGEPWAAAPELNTNSTPADFSEWLSRADMVFPGTDDMFARIISYTPQMTTAVVWINEYAPQEIHDHEYERFLILEGTCDIMGEDEVNHLVPGDYFAIPLHKSHLVKVTSPTACKVILQRIAA